MIRLPLRSRPAFTACLVLASTLTASGAGAASAPEGASWQFTPFAGYTFFVDPISGPAGARYRAKDAAHFGGSIGLQASRLFGIQVGGGYTPTDVDAPGGSSVKFAHAAGDLLLSPLHGDGWDLYGLAGGGYERISVAGGRRHFGSLDIGAGLRCWLTGHVALRAEVRNVLVLAPVSKLQESRDNYVLLVGGLTFAVGGKAKDSDGDGVPDRKDQCANTPVGAHVDAKGCPIDGDGDGVPDGIDQCADTPSGAVVDAKGCPTDGDGDGVYDGIDQCADTPSGATVDAKGCPIDSDGDGVPDGIDRCADTPSGAKVDAKGCPSDSDGDGVFDGIDQCPNTGAGLKVDKDGCPIEVIEKETELLDTGMIRLEDVNFATGKADLLPESLPILDIVGQVLSKWPELRIEIGGHTDSRGSTAYNQKLSDARAASVEQYLLQKFPGLKPEQFTVKGYGESKPLVPNTSALNLAKNRRVEFVVLNQDVLKREVEKRKLLKK